MGGSDTPLKGIFIQAIHPDCSQYTKSIIREGDRVKKIQGRNIDQFTHSEAITLFSKVTRTRYGFIFPERSLKNFKGGALSSKIVGTLKFCRRLKDLKNKPK